MHAGSGGNAYAGTSAKRNRAYENTPEEWAYLNSGERQLYNLKVDPDERVNLAERFPEKVLGLSLLAKCMVEEGRSTRGPAQAYVSEKWGQIEWTEALP